MVEFLPTENESPTGPDALPKLLRFPVYQSSSGLGFASDSAHPCEDDDLDRLPYNKHPKLMPPPDIHNDVDSSPISKVLAGWWGFSTSFMLCQST